MEGPLRQKEIFRWLAETEDRHSDTSNAALIHESAAHPDIRSSNVQNADTDNIKLQSHRPLRELAAHYQPEKVSTSRRQIKRRCPSIVSSSLTSTGRRQDYERQLGRKYSPQPASSSPDLSEATVAPADLRTFLQQANGAAEPYRRQRRHKTREDRYELKEHTNRRHERDGKNKTEEKHGTRRKRQNKTKTGTDLLRSFNAANVASERLTLEPTNKIGLFTKGRASSPYRRKALPDLCFSELKFLGRSHQPQEGNERQGRVNLGKRKHRQVEQNEEISKFFGSRGLPLKVISTNELNRAHMARHSLQPPQSPQKRPKMNPVVNSQPSLPPVNLPGPLFLGFGAPAPHSTSLRATSGGPLTSSPNKLLNSYKQQSSQACIPWSQSPVTPRTHLRRLKQSSGHSVSPKRSGYDLVQCSPKSIVPDRKEHSPRNLKHAAGHRAVSPEEHVATQPIGLSTTQHPTIATSGKHSPRGDLGREQSRHREARAKEEAREISGENNADCAPNPNKSLLFDQNEKEQSFMEDLGKFFQKWATAEPPVFRTADPNPGVIAVQRQDAIANKNENTDPTRSCSRKARNGKEMAKQVGPIETAHKNPNDKPKQDDSHAAPFKDPSDAQIDDQVETRTTDELTPQAQSLELPRQGYFEANQQTTVPMNPQAAMPFPNVHARHLGPSLFLSPDSIYERQIQEQEANSVTARRPNRLSGPWHSRLLDEPSTSTSTSQPFSRHFAQPVLRPETVKSHFNSPSLPPPSTRHLSAQIHYQTPSMSSFSTAAQRSRRWDNLVRTTPEHSRFFSHSSAGAPPDPRNLCHSNESTELQDPILHRLHSRQDSEDAGQAAPSAHSFSIHYIPPVPWNKSPSIAEETIDEPPYTLTGFFEHSMFKAPSAEVQSHGAEPLALYQDGGTDEDFPANFWAPNKLY